ncbi:MAG: phosphatidylinositol kinase, partial [Actinobacteria bacterium]|nr:phosphatidylinositol kinase [Actinomycetota bacterium]
MPEDEAELTQPAPEGTDEVAILLEGEIEVLGRMPWSSNATYLVEVHRDGIDARAIYKPHRGER